MSGFAPSTAGVESRDEDDLNELEAIIAEEDIDWDGLMSTYNDEWHGGGEEEFPGDDDLSFLATGGGGAVPGAGGGSGGGGGGGGGSLVKRGRGQTGSEHSSQSSLDLSSSRQNSGRQSPEKKLMRNDSLKRIIISTQLTESSSATAAATATVASDRNSRSAISSAPPDELVSHIVDLFNLGDLDTLSIISELRLADNVELVSSVIFNRATKQTMPLRGKKFVMLLWGLQLELFPDSVWIAQPNQHHRGCEGAAGGSSSKSCSSALGASTETTIFRNFSFSGTRIYRSSTMALYEYVCRHAYVVDPTLSQPFVHTEGGGLHIVLPASGSSGDSLVTAGSVAVVGGLAAAKPRSEHLQHTKVVELLAEADATERLLTYRQMLSSRNLFAVAMTEGGVVVDNVPRQLECTFNEAGMITRIVSRGDL